MVFTHNKNADQFDPLSYGNLRVLETNSQPPSFTEMSSGDAASNSNVTGLGKENMFSNSEESKFGNAGLKDSSPISLENFSFSSLPASSCQSSTLDHGKRPLSDVKPCQVACKRPKQTDGSTWLYSYEGRPFSIAAETSASALADGFVETEELDHIHANNGTTICSTNSGIPYPNCKQPIGEESLYLPDWVTSFPGYFEGLVAEYNQVDDIESPVHEYLPRKAMAIGPGHQADIPEWRPRVSMNIPGTSGSCADLAHGSVSISAARDEDSESDKWIRHCIIPMPSFSCPVAWVGDYKTDCECSDEGSIRCARQHVMEARENLKKSMGHDKFRELGLCEMGEDIAQRWTDEEEKLFQRVISSNPISLGKNFWDYLPHALPGKTSKELVSYYFNVFMLQKRAHQNRSDLLHVDSDADESPGEPAVTEQEDEDSAMESPTHGRYIDNTVSTEDVHDESEEQLHTSFPEKVIDNVPESRRGPNQTPLESNPDNPVEDVGIQVESCASFEGQHNGGHGPNGVQCAAFHVMPSNDGPDNNGDQGACV